MKRWRYQPVYDDTTEGRIYSLCECFFDAADRLEEWNPDLGPTPAGYDLLDLTLQFASMLTEACKWGPVARADLRVGMTFERTGVAVEAMVAAIGRARAGLIVPASDVVLPDRLH